MAIQDLLFRTLMGNDYMNAQRLLEQQEEEKKYKRKEGERKVAAEEAEYQRNIQRSQQAFPRLFQQGQTVGTPQGPQQVGTTRPGATGLPTNLQFLAGRAQPGTSYDPTTGQAAIKTQKPDKPDVPTMFQLHKQASSEAFKESGGSTLFGFDPKQQEKFNTTYADKMRNFIEQYYPETKVKEGKKEDKKTELPKGVTESDIEFTMKKHKLTRDEVLKRIGK